MAKLDRDGTAELLRKWSRREQRRKRLAFLFRPVSWVFNRSPGVALSLIAVLVLGLAFSLGALAASCQAPCSNTCGQPPDY